MYLIIVKCKCVKRDLLNFVEPTFLSIGGGRQQHRFITLVPDSDLLARKSMKTVSASQT
jgi:hypothetical protein